MLNFSHIPNSICNTKRAILSLKMKHKNYHRKKWKYYPVTKTILTNCLSPRITKQILQDFTLKWIKNQFIFVPEKPFNFYWKFHKLFNKQQYKKHRTNSHKANIKTVYRTCLNRWFYINWQYVNNLSNDGIAVRSTDIIRIKWKRNILIDFNLFLLNIDWGIKIFSILVKDFLLEIINII